MVKGWFSLLLLLTVSGTWAALPEGCVPPPTDRVFVYDFAGELDDDEEELLNRNLRQFTDTTSHVIVVVIHPDFCGLEPATFATDLGHSWGVGRADEDNGVVVAIRPRSGNRGGALFIAPGYGLEGAIPDLVAARVVQEMTPYLARGNYLGALERGTHDLMQLAAGEWTQADYLSAGGEVRTGIVAFLLFLLVLFGVPGFAIWSSVRSLQRKQGIDWTAAWILFWAASQRSSGRYRQFHHSSGPFGRGGSGFGGGGGGGFGGFGGGGFGGGGAGGSF